MRRIAAVALALTALAAAPASAAELVVSGPTAQALRDQGVRVEGPVFAGHPEWRVWAVDGPVDRIRAAGDVRWIERQQVVASSRPRDVARAAPRAIPRAAASAPVPPSGCSGSGGLAAGVPDDPSFCNEPLGPFYAENWNLFCFTPATQRPSVVAGSPDPPKSAGICAQGAWKLGAQGQGTVIAILDSGVDYLHPDLIDRMADATSVPALADPRFPGKASDGQVHGWNFQDDNAEPMDYFGHGTGRAGIAAAAADNGYGIAGVAPRARILAVKVSDTYVVTAERLAQGVVYAADHGADVINTSLGATGNSRLLRLAALYADAKGVFWAGATANEYSTHHNYPTNLDTVVGIGGVTPSPSVDQAQRDGLPAQPVTTFLQKTNYANYGGILDLSAPIDTPSTTSSASACGGDPLAGGKCAGKGRTGFHASGTSTAAPHAAGVAALVRSAGFLAGLCGGQANVDGALAAGCSQPTLTPNEIRQLMIYTATRIVSGVNYPAFTGTDPSLMNGGLFYPQTRSEPRTGWSMWNGFGRIDAYAAAAFAAAGLVPPEVQLYGAEPPPGVRAFRGRRGPRLFAVIDPERTPRIPIVGHVSARSAGVTWKVQVASCLEPKESDFSDVGTGEGPTDGVLARLDAQSLVGERCAEDGPLHPFSPPGTVTVRVLAALPGDVADPTAGINPAGATPPPSPLIGQDRRVLTIRPADHDAPGSPFALRSSGEGSPTLYDLEGRGQLDVIIPTADGTVLALRPDGTRVKGWPVRLRPLRGKGIAKVGAATPKAQVIGAVAVGDIDGDREPEVVASADRLYAWHRNGRRVKGFPKRLAPAPLSAEPTAGTPEGASGDYCLKPHPATYAERFSDYGGVAAPVLADLNGDRRLDVLVAEGNQCVYAVTGRGKLLWAVSPNSTNSDTTKIVATPAVGDMDGDGSTEIVVGTEEVVGSIPSTSGRLYVLEGATGAIRPGWPVSLPSVAASGVPTVATGVVSSPILFPAPDGKGLHAAAGVFLGGDPANPVRTYGPDGTAGPALDMTSGGAGSNARDTPFHWGITQAAYGKLGETSAVVTGLFGNSLSVDTAADPSLKPSFEHLVGAWDPVSGDPVATFPRQIEDWQFLSGPVVADVKGDGTRQVVAGSGAGYLHAFDPAGAAGAAKNLSTSLVPYEDRAEPEGFPVHTGFGYITSTPAVGQLRRGGPVTIATVTRDGYLFLTETKGKPRANDQWWRFHHDERNTGAYGLDTRPPATFRKVRLKRGQRLRFRHVGDDWWIGRARSVQVRWARKPIRSAAAFARARRVRNKIPVRGTGTWSTVRLRGVPRRGRVFVAIRAIDDAGNAGLVKQARR